MQRLKLTLKIVTISISTIICSNCGGIATSANPAESAKGGNIAGNSSAGTLEGKGDIYGEDNRKEVYETKNPALKTVADATAALISADRILQPNKDGMYSISAVPLDETRDLCRDVRFREQPSASRCTAFLVAPDLLATAGHCLETCSDTKAVFDFEYSDPEDTATEVPSSSVYSCKKVEARESNGVGSEDWALVRLNNPVMNRPVLDFSTKGKPSHSTRLAVVGHPYGLPKKVASNGERFEPGSAHAVRHDMTADSNETMLTTIDASGGNSGSPVVSARTGKVIGIHSAGGSDFGTTVSMQKSLSSLQTCKKEVECEKGAVSFWTSGPTTCMGSIDSLTSSMSRAYARQDNWYQTEVEVSKSEKSVGFSFTFPDGIDEVERILLKIDLREPIYEFPLTRINGRFDDVPAEYAAYTDDPGYGARDDTYSLLWQESSGDADLSKLRGPVDIELLEKTEKFDLDSARVKLQAK